ATKSLSTSPVGLMAIPAIIFDIAASFSARNAASLFSDVCPASGSATRASTCAEAPSATPNAIDNAILTTTAADIPRGRIQHQYIQPSGYGGPPPYPYHRARHYTANALMRPVCPPV